jgi:hypothetical protein
MEKRVYRRDLNWSGLYPRRMKEKAPKFGKYEIRVKGSSQRKVIAGEQVAVGVKFETGQGCIHPGGSIWVEIPVGWSEPQTREPEAAGFIRVSSTARGFGVSNSGKGEDKS